MTPRSSLLWTLLLACAALGQDDELLPPDEVSDLVERYHERGVESLREGGYVEARLRFRKALERDPEHVGARLGTVEAWKAFGAYDKARRELDKLFEHHPGHRAGLVERAELDLLEGKDDDARAAARKALEKASGGEGPDLAGLAARVVLAEGLAFRGRRGEARTVLDYFLDYYERRAPAYETAWQDSERLRFRPAEARPLAREMVLVAKALRHYVELSPLDHDFLNNANQLLKVARDVDKRNWEAWIEWIRVTRVERERANAKANKALTIVKRANPDLADLWTEVARTMIVNSTEWEAREPAETALRINPRQNDARAILARMLMVDDQYGEAADHIEKGLGYNPRHKDLLTLKATLLRLTGDEEGFEQGLKDVLRVDPTYGEAYHLAGLVVAGRQRRFEEAVELVRRGLEIDSKNFDAHASLGLFLANLGREREALESLEKSRELIPFSHPVRDNFSRLLEYITGTMTEHRTDNFVLRFDPAEDPVLRRYVPDVLEEYWDDITKRYGFVPDRPVLVETFRKPADFSVRVLGLTGIPALGVCFGGVIGLQSPEALQPQRFRWIAVAHHEFAHVMTLQLSKGRVPRWFTEGVSVFEERPNDPAWGRNAGFERQILDAVAAGTLPHVGKFDAWFRGPRVAFAYYLSGLMVEHLHEKHGEQAIVEALKLWAQDKSAQEVFQGAFGVGLREFDEEFATLMAQRVAGYDLMPNYAPVLVQLRSTALNQRDGEPDAELLEKIAWGYYQRQKMVDAGDYLARARRARGGKDSATGILLRAHLERSMGRAEQARRLYEAFFAAGGEDYDARMQMAAFHSRRGPEGEQEFLKHILAAKKAWPLAPQPYSLLRTHHMRNGNEEAALKEFEEVVRLRPHDVKIRMQLAREYLARGRDKDALAALEDALGITVFDRSVHLMALPLFRKFGRTKDAVRSARCAVELLDTDQDPLPLIANTWLDLAEALLADGQPEKARAAVAEARRILDGEEFPRLEEVEKKLASG